MHIVNIVLGYGVPEHILTDRAYTTYLTVAFNRMYAQAERDQVKEPRVILCGGPTDLRGGMRTEAGEMKTWMLDHMKKVQVSGWHLFTEDQSLSTLENIMFAKRLIAAKQIPFHEIHIYCEQTRLWRVSQIVEELFGGISYEVHGIDFDCSPRRYQGLESLLNQERIVCKHDLWAIESQEHFQAHHALYEKKIKILREKEASNMEEALKEWEDIYLKETAHLR